MIRVRTVFLIGLLCLAAAPATASATVVGTSPINSCGSERGCLKAGAGEPTSVITVTGDPGESNSVTITGSRDEVVVSDVAAPLRAQGECTLAPDRTVHCPARRIQFYATPGLVALDVRLGDENDSLLVFDGVVRAGVFNGGPGDDRIAIGGGGPTGRFSGRPVVRGGPGDDRLDGGRGSDVLDGGLGEDFLDGGGSPDDLSGGRGADRLVGGTGGDRIDARDREADEVRCDSGRDRVTADRSDRPLRRCERRGYPRRASRR